MISGFIGHLLVNLRKQPELELVHSDAWEWESRLGWFVGPTEAVEGAGRSLQLAFCYSAREEPKGLGLG